MIENESILPVNISIIAITVKQKRLMFDNYLSSVSWSSYTLE